MKKKTQKELKSKTKVNMFDAQAKYFEHKDEYDKAVLGVMASGDYVNGQPVRDLERNLSKYLGIKHVIGCANGTDAIQIALMALKLPPGSKILLQDYNYVSAREMVNLMGFKPIYVDVDAEYNIDPPSLEATCVSNVDARVLIISHLFGQSADMAKIVSICKKYGLFLIEDNAQGLGSTFKGKKLGTFGDISTTSFYPTKTLGCFGDGGAVFTNNSVYASRMRMIANHGQMYKYDYRMQGINSRMDSIQAAILNIKLKYLSHDFGVKKSIAERYDEGLAHLVGVPEKIQFREHKYHQYCILVGNKRVRDSLKNHLLAKGISTEIYYPSVSFKDSEHGMTKILSERTLALPIHTRMTYEQVERVVMSIQQFYYRK